MATTVFFRNKHTDELEGAVIIPSWLWIAVMQETRRRDCCAGTIVRDALKQYLAKYNPANRK